MHLYHFINIGNGSGTTEETIPMLSLNRSSHETEVLSKPSSVAPSPSSQQRKSMISSTSKLVDISVSKASPERETSDSNLPKSPSRKDLPAEAISSGQYHLSQPETWTHVISLDGSISNLGNHINQNVNTIPTCTLPFVCALWLLVQHCTFGNHLVAHKLGTLPPHPPPPLSCVKYPGHMTLFSSYRINVAVVVVNMIRVYVSEQLREIFAMYFSVRYRFLSLVATKLLYGVRYYDSAVQHGVWLDFSFLYISCIMLAWSKHLLIVLVNHAHHCNTTVQAVVLLRICGFQMVICSTEKSPQITQR